MTMSDYTEDDPCPGCGGPLVEHDEIPQVTCPNPECTWKDDSCDEDDEDDE